MQCPKCGGDCWDNRPKKKTGDFKASAPDFKCKDKNCGHVIWPPKPGEGRRAAPAEDDLSWLDDGPEPAPISRQRREAEPTPLPIKKVRLPDPVYWLIFAETVEALKDRYAALTFGGERIPVTLGEIFASVATQYIELCKKNARDS